MKNLLLLLLVSTSSFSQVGIGTSTPNSSAALDVTSTTKGLLPPRLTSVQMNAITTPANGLIVYCTDCTPTGIYAYNSPSWSALGGASSGTPTSGGSSGNTTYGIYDVFSTSALPTSGYLRQGTGPHLSATYPALAAVMPAFTNTFSNTGQGQAYCLAAKSSTMIVFNGTTYGYTTNNGVTWSSVTHNIGGSPYGADQNNNYAFVVSNGSSNGLLVDLNSPSLFSLKALNNTSGFGCTATGSSGFLVSNYANFASSSVLQRTTDNFNTRTNVTLPADFLSNAYPPPLIKGHYLTNTVIAVRTGIYTTTVARSTDNGATWTNISLPTQTAGIAGIATSATGKWLLTTYGTNTGFTSDNDGLTWTAYTPPNSSLVFNVAGWDGVRWIIAAPSQPNQFWYSTTGATGTWVNKQLGSGNSINNYNLVSTPARLGTDNSLWVTGNDNNKVINLNAISTQFSIPAVTEPSGGQYWVKATAP